MAYVLADRVKETTTSTGTGNLTLAGAVTGFRTFSSVLTSGDCFTYAVVDSTGSQWEVGLGTLSGTNVLVRGTLFASSTGSTINFSAGTKNVFITQSGANQFNVFDDAQNAIETPVDTANGYMRRQYTVPQQGANPSGSAVVTQAVYYSSAGTTLEAGYVNPSTAYSRYAYSGISASSNAVDQSYLNTNAGDWNWTGGPHTLFLSYMSFAGAATNGVTSNAIETNHQFWQAYSGTPTFNYWDAPSTTYFPVTTGDIMVGDGSTVPKWYRRTTTGWEPFGVAKITAGAGISVTNNGVGEVTISAGAPPVGPGWYSYLLINPTTGSDPMAVPTDWIASPGYMMWAVGDISATGWNPTPSAPPWFYNTINSLGWVYDCSDASLVVDPTVISCGAGNEMNVRMFFIDPAAYGNVSYYTIYANAAFGSGFSSTLANGGWPVFGASQHGFGCVKINGGDFTATLTALNCTIEDSYYYVYGNYTIVFFSGDASQVALWSGYSSILDWGTPTVYYVQLWYTYT